MNDLDLRVRRDLRPFAQGDLEEIDSEAKAISVMASRSGLQDKALAIECGIDPAVLSKAKTGQARLPEQQMDALMDACGSELWLSYWLARRGYDPRYVRRFETDLERENRELRERIDRLEQERAIEIRLVREMRAA